ncbi:Stk1 family PASTA domain-containing Ser/Thr kinase [Marisediminicola sp. LYQ85]|uniref:Stk1 family PASTA domain-containing Ser/Thr kinase n=1 Tax=Marisediminicola sp. LYQ85 TaxID=3391062 RepID=UPI0039838ACA
MTTNSTDPMIGRLVDGRYQVRSRIARGGMATVYLATDLRLERRVAIKVMHGHLADDSQYRARFIQEARSAARLAHPNVVNVYDQGQDADTAYLVMEYLPGITLRDLLEEHHVLTTMQAFDIMEAVLSGLAAAHKNGIVHRDLKPENVLLADDGRIKIGDFGLARAATANTATGNALLGTIAYLSPELVTRGIADTRSDIYAVGIMLYEMLAGEQPFKGEQPFQIAHQHANDTVGTPSSKNPAVPTELDELVLWATARDPDQRPRDAKTMLDQLLDTGAQLATAAPATAAHRTMVMPTAAPSSSGSDDVTQIIRPQRRERTGPVVADSASALQKTASRRKRKGFVLFALVILLAGLAAGTGWYFNAGPGALVSVPDVSGSDVATATATLEELELVVAAETRGITDPDTSIPVGSVVGTDPDAGAQLARQTTVTLLTNLGPEQLPVPELVGLTEAEAREAIESAGFTAQDSATQFSSDVPADTVIAATGAEGVDLTTVDEYGEDQPVTLLVSLGAVPDVRGQGFAQALETLEGVGLSGVEGERAFDDAIPEGSVLSAAAPGDGPVTPGDTLTLAVSDGPAPVTVPEVNDLPRDEAIAALEGLGLDVSYNPLFAPFSGARATGTDPEAGTVLPRGSSVTLFLQLIG